MDVINKFLETNFNQEPENIKTSQNRLGELNALFNKSVTPPSVMRILPKVKHNQIWTIKKDYLDYEGDLQQIKHPMMVLLTCDSEDLDDETQFVRGCPISPFVEMASEDDQICEDSSITGFPFLIEIWNEQPMLVEILDKFVGNYYAEFINSESALTNEQSSFREIEISNARYLNRSISAYLNEKENANNFSFSVDFLINSEVRTLHMPKLKNQSQTLKPLNEQAEYALVARSGNTLTDNDYIEIDTTNMPFHIEVRKKNDEYILTIIPEVEITLSTNGKIISSYSNNNRIVYSGLKQGLYNIETPLTTNKITIRLK